MSKHFKIVKEKPITPKQYEKILLKNFKKGYMYVIDNEPIGGFLWFNKNGEEYELEEIFVTQKRKGYGRQLLTFLINKAKKQKIKKINLDIHIKNKSAINFFKRHGFTERTIEMGLNLK